MFTNKHNKLILILLLIFSSTGINAQDIKDKSVNATEAEYLPGVILPLNETQKIRYEFPGKLNYWEMKSGLSKLPTYPGDTKAKVEMRDNKPVDYKFVFTSPGLEYTENSGPVPFSGGKGKVINIKYSFPCRLEVKDANDNLLKTFILDDGTQEYTTTYSPDFLGPEPLSQYEYDIKPTKGFTQKDEQIMKAFAEKEKEILARVEYNQMAKMGYKAYNIIYAGYGGLKTSKPSVLTIDKKYKDKFPELDAAIEKLTADVATFYTGNPSNELRNRLGETGKFFASQYNDGSSKEMKKICSYNSSLAYTLAGKSDEAYEQYKVAYKQYGLFSSPSNLARIFDNTVLMYQIAEAKDVPAYAYSEPRTISYRENEVITAKRERAQAELDALLAYNVNNEPAVVIDKDGKELTGTLEMIVFKAKESGIVDLDFGKYGTLKFEDGKGTFVKVGNTKSIKVGERIYEPVKEKESAGFKILRVATTGSGGTFFMPRVFEYGNYVGYFNVQSEYYLVRNINEEESIALSSLLGNGKDAKAYREACTELESKIENKEIKNDLEGLKTYIKLIADCKK